MNAPTPINQQRLVALTHAAIQSLNALLREIGEGQTGREEYEGYLRGALDITRQQTKPAATSRQGPRCPDCGGEMVSRNSSRGQFYGCRQYPHCKGRRPGDGESRQQ